MRPGLSSISGITLWKRQSTSPKWSHQRWGALRRRHCYLNRCQTDFSRKTELPIVVTFHSRMQIPMHFPGTDFQNMTDAIFTLHCGVKLSFYPSDTRPSDTQIAQVFRSIGSRKTTALCCCQQLTFTILWSWASWISTLEFASPLKICRPPLTKWCPIHPRTT